MTEEAKERRLSHGQLELAQMILKHKLIRKREDSIYFLIYLMCSIQAIVELNVIEYKV